MCGYGPVTTCNIAFSTLPKSHFGSTRKYKMLLWRTSRKQCCMCSSGSKHTFSPSDYPKIRFLRGRGSDISMVSLALIRHIMLSGLSKMLHVLGRQTNLASGRRTFAYIFVFWLSQNTNLRCRECDYSMGSLALTRNFVLSGLSKMWLAQGPERNVASGQRTVTTYFSFLAIPKYDFCHVEKAMIQWVSWYSQGILYFLAYPKCGLYEVEIVMVQVFVVRYAHVFAFFLSQSTTLVTSRKRWFKGFLGPDCAYYTL